MAKKKPKKASKKEDAKTKKKLLDKEAKAKQKLLDKEAKAKQKLLDDAAEAEQKLRDYYALGQEILAESKKAKPKGKKYSAGVIQGFADKIGKSLDYFEKARRFAKAYKEKPFEKLCKLRNSKGMPLTTDHVRKLLPLDERLREELQSEAAKNAWGSKRFADEIRKRTGKSSKKRRGPTRPKTGPDALAHIEKMSDGWLRWLDGLQDPGDKKLGREAATVDDLPPQVQQELESTINAIKKLLAEVEEALKLERKKQGKAKRAKRKKSAKKRPKA